MTRDELFAKLGVKRPAATAPSLSRREVLRLTGVGLAALGAGCGSSGQKQAAPPNPSTDAGCEPSACVDDSGTLLVSLADNPTLSEVGGFAVIKDPSYSDPLCNQDQIIVIQTASGQYTALSASCSHMCCIVGYDPSLQKLVCPCHGSEYALTGEVVRGPAQTALVSYPTCADACNVYVKLT